MECNKEEAVRARDIAEKKLKGRDFVGARKFAIKAQQLFPDLENISQMLTVCEVHCSSESKSFGTEKDWYGILQVEATADEASIKKQYRKLALQLHPDKNKFEGAEAAFKLIGEAQRTLCDQAKRTLYDMKRKDSIRTGVPRQSTQPPNGLNRNPYQPGIQNPFTSYSKPQFSGLHQQRPPHQQPPLPTQTQGVFNTPTAFWTLCPHCGAKYQYYRNVMNKPISCPNCVKSFIASEIIAEGARPKPSVGHMWNQSAPVHQKQVPVQSAPNVGQYRASVNASSTKAFQGNAGGMAMPTGPSKAGSSTKVDCGKEDKARTKFESVKLHGSEKGEQRGRPAGNSGLKRGRKMTVISDDSDDTDDEDISMEEVMFSDQQNDTASFSRYPRRSSRHKQEVTYKEDASDDDDVENLPGFKRLRKAGSSVHDNRTDGGHLKEDARKDDEKLLNAKEQMGNCKSDREEVNKANCTIDLTSDSNTLPVHLDYPDAEFNDFEKVKEANKFAVDQTWALYDDCDGMPRYYARIRKVYSPEFKLRITWLEADPISKDEIIWFKSELPIACGNFKLGESEETENRLMFSHMVYPSKGRRRNSFELYPKRGETWALFKDWNVKWSSDPDTFRKFNYEIVEILSDYSWKEGITLCRLVKVEGFICLFQRSTSEGASFHVPPSEVLRFSHCIPSFRLTGKERKDVPVGSLELDPASLPPDIETTAFKSPKHATIVGDREKDHEKPPVQLRNHGKSHAESEVEAKKMDDCNGSCSKPPLKEKTSPTVKPMSSKKNVASNEDIVQENRSHSPKVADSSLEKQQKPADLSPSDEAINRESAGLNGYDYNKIDDSNVPECQTSKDNQVPDTDGRSSASSPQQVTLRYPDPEFHSFDEERLREKFRPGQIWALYSDIDGYPKFYARVKKVELEYFKVQISWLEQCPASETENQWYDNELPAGCGNFKVANGVDETYDSTETFSHQMQVVQTGKKHRYAIYPRKHEIWAVFKNWRPSWKESDLGNCELDVVEVLTDDAPFELSVLEKVNGYRSVFRKGSPAVMMKITKDEILRFSHHIPSFKLTEERGGKLRGCFELDPASVPQDLLFVDAD
ncbi:hypothetical protein QJS10_CPA05g00550 [Acorus calamus]|uniref:J domain-containing protein n=1 Tax=Acorus calamus TaxID=4465 RepID=A0AAV9EW67_ACOCL|nr:hypothetical protein QJS10_CPA05g00550 [Acorus calamus]